MDTRIGYPNEHLAGDSDKETTSPVYATAVGLVLNSLEIVQKHPEKQSDQALEEQLPLENAPGETQEQAQEASVRSQPRRTIFEKWFEKFKDFLDNAE